MPLPPPFTTATLPLRSAIDGHLRRAFEVSIKLVATRRVGVWPLNAAVVLLGGRVQRPIRICEVGSSEAAEVRSAGGNDAVHMVELENIADGDGGNADLVANPVGKR